MAHSGDNNTNPPPEEDDWITKAINFLSGGAVDDAHAMLALDASNASTLDKAMFNIALNSRDIKSEFMGYGMGARGRSLNSKHLNKLVSNTTKKAGNAIQLTFDKKISSSKFYKQMNPKALNINSPQGFKSANGIKWQYYKGGKTNPNGWTIKGITPNKQTIIMRFSK